MTTLYEPAVGRWWRAERYDIREGLIRPVEGAGGEFYDPWEEYGLARENGLPTPYESLFEMMSQLELEPSSSEGAVAFSARSLRRLTDWCAGHGLLGLLPHRTRLVTLTPRWRRAEGNILGPIVASWGKDYVLVPMLEELVVGSGGWLRTGRPYIVGGEGIVATENREDEGRVVPLELRDKSWPSPGVLIDVKGRLQNQSLSIAWHPYFPDVPSHESESHPYPLPGTQRFFESYAEPLDAFLTTAADLRRALLLLGELAPREEVSPSARQHVGMGQRLLDALASPISPSIWPQEDGTFRLAWPTPSLIGAYAFMAMRDLEGQQRLLVCGVCSRPFVTKAYQAKYCSEKCRHTGQKRAQRQRAKERS